MLHIRQKRASKSVTFAKQQPFASGSKSMTKGSSSTSQPPAKSRTKVNTSKPQSHRRGPSTTSSAPPKVSNGQRRLASLFMALMASSSMPIETDAETLEAAQKASIAPKAPTHKHKVSTIKVQEIKAGRWKRFRYEMSLKTKRKGKAKTWDELELDHLVELRGEGWGIVR